MSCVIAQGGSNNEDWLMFWTPQVILSLVEDTAVISSVYAQFVWATTGQPFHVFLRHREEWKTVGVEPEV